MGYEHGPGECRKKLFLTDAEKLLFQNKDSFVITRKHSNKLGVDSDFDFYRYYIGDRVIVNWNETLDVVKNADGGIPYVNITGKIYKVVDRKEINDQGYSPTQLTAYGDYDKIAIISFKETE